MRCAFWDGALIALAIMSTRECDVAGNLFDDCFRILKETEEVLTRARDVFRGLAQGGKEDT